MHPLAEAAEALPVSVGCAGDPAARSPDPPQRDIVAAEHEPRPLQHAGLHAPQALPGRGPAAVPGWAGHLLGTRLKILGENSTELRTCGLPMAFLFCGPSNPRLLDLDLAGSTIVMLRYLMHA